MTSLGELTLDLRLNDAGYSRDLAEARRLAQQFDRDFRRSFSNTKIPGPDIDFRSAERSVRSFTSRTDDILTGAFRQLGGSLTNILAGALSSIASIPGQTLGSFQSFEGELNQLSVVTRASREELSGVTDEVRRLGIETSKAPGEVIAAANALATLGQTPVEIETNLPSVVALSEATRADLELSANLIAKVGTVFGTAADNAADAITTLRNTSAALPEDITFLLQQAGAVAESTETEFLDLSAAFATLRDAGINARPAATGLRNILQNLNPTAASAQEAISALNLELIDSQTGNFAGFEELLAQLQASRQGFIDSGEGLAAYNRNLQVLFGREGVVALTTLLAQVDGAFAKNTRSLGNIEGAASSASESLLVGLSGALQRFQGTIQTLAIDLGKALAPVAEAAVQLGITLGNALLEADVFSTLAEGANTLKEAISGNPELIQGLADAFVSLSQQAAVVVGDFFTQLAEDPQEIADSFNGLITIVDSFNQTLQALGAVLPTVLNLGQFLNDAAIAGVKFSGVGLLVQGVSGAFDALRGPLNAISEAWDGFINLVDRGIDATSRFLGVAQQVQAVAITPSIDTSALEQGSSAISDAISRLTVPEPTEQPSNQPTGDFEPQRTEAQQLANIEQELFEISQRRLAGLTELANANVSAEEAAKRRGQVELAAIRDTIEAQQRQVDLLRSQSEGGADNAEELQQAEQRLAQSRLQLAEETASQREAIEQAALNRIVSANDEAVRTIEQSQASQLRSIGNLQVGGLIDEDEAASRRLRAEQSATQQLINEYNRQLSALDDVIGQGVIATEQGAQQRLSIEDSLGQALDTQIQQQLELQRRARDERVKLFDDVAEVANRQIKERTDAFLKAVDVEQKAELKAFDESIKLAEKEAEFRERQLQKQQDAEQRALAERQQAEQDAQRQRLSALERFVDRELQLEEAADDEERKRLEAQFEEEDNRAKRRRELQEEALQNDDSIVARDNRSRGGGLSPFEQDQRDFEESQQQTQDALAAKQEAQQLRLADLRSAQEEDFAARREELEAQLALQREGTESNIAEFRKSVEDELAVQRKEAETGLQQDRAAFAAEQRQLDIQAANTVANILEGINIPGITITPRRHGGPVGPGGSYLVGEAPNIGPELGVFGSKSVLFTEPTVLPSPPQGRIYSPEQTKRMMAPVSISQSGGSGDIGAKLDRLTNELYEFRKQVGPIKRLAPVMEAWAEQGVENSGKLKRDILFQVARSRLDLLRQQL